jgi:cellulose synthase operon protein C
MSPETIKLRSAVSVREPFYQEFAEVVRAISTDKPLLFVLDTFEMVQQYGVDIVHEVWEFLDDLLRRLPSLRVVIAGRALLDGYRTKPVHLAGFDDESARGFMSSLLGPELAADTELVGHIVRIVGRNPLSQRLGADLVVNHGAEELDDINGRRALFVRVKTEQIQGWLYKRILDRIADPDVRALAHPGLVVRRLTPGVIRYVLAGPCHVEVPDDARALELFDACAREVSLLSHNADGSLQHRADIRREMLPLLRRADPDRVADIHSAAVEYYQPHSDITSRAEELYHRLCLRDSTESLDKRWQRGVENYLGMSLEELPAEGQVYLGSRLGITLPPDVVSQAKLHEQERYTVTRVRQLIRLGELDTALDVIGEQVNRTPDGPLDVLEAQVLEELGRLDEASRVLDRASQRAADAADSKLLPELQYVAARLAERQGQTERALELLAAARATMPEPPDPLMLVRLRTTELRVRRTASGENQAEAAQPEISTARAELIRLVDASPQEQIAKEPALLVELASEIGEARPTVVLQALLLFGLPSLSNSQAGQLATALAHWDARNNHRPASGLRLPAGPGSQMGAWEEWLRNTPTKTAAQRLAAILNRSPTPSPSSSCSRASTRSHWRHLGLVSICDRGPV